MAAAGLSPDPARPPAALTEPDWEAPWLAPWQQLGPRAWRQWQRLGDLPQALNALGGAPVRFVPQAQLPAGEAYESHIHRHGEVPTREGWHDFFNALCWLRFGASKRVLNRLQAAAIAHQGVQPVRGPLRDALTLFDENAGLLQAPPEIWQALLARDWWRLFVDLRPRWAESRLLLFGHALQEKLVSPYKGITAHLLLQPVPSELGGDWARWDHWLSQQLQAQAWQPKPFTPLPVLGVPGWSADPQDRHFYLDAQVFRPVRPAQAVAEP